MYSKPRAGARPRSTHPHAQGLRHCFLFNEGSGRIVTDCVGGLQLAFTGGVAQTWGANSWGQCINFATGGSLELVSARAFGRWSGVTAEANRAYSVVVGLQQTSSQTGYRNIWAQQGGKGLYLNGGKVEWFDTTASSQTISLDTPHVISVSAAGPNAGVSKAAGEQQIHIDGRLDSTMDYATWDASPWVAGQKTMGNDSLSEQYLGSVSFLYVYDRFLGDGAQNTSGYNLQPTGSRGMMPELHADPFDMFRPAKRWLFMSVAAVPNEIGTGAIAFGKSALAATGTVDAPDEAGVASIAFSHPVLAGTATVFNPPVTGVGAQHFTKPTLAASGSFFGFSNEAPPGVFDFDACSDWESDPIVPGTNPLPG